MKITPCAKQVACRLAIPPAVMFVAAIVFVRLNLTGTINAATNVPPIVEWGMDWLLSTTSMYVLLAAMLVLAVLHRALKPSVARRGRVRKVFFLVLSFLAGKLYWWGGFLIAWCFSARYVSYVPPISQSLIAGPMSLLMGFMTWWLVRHASVGLWRKRLY